MPKLHVFGCSYTWGDGLPDCFEDRSRHSSYTWAALTAKQLGLQLRVHARSGSSPKAVLYQLTGLLDSISAEDTVIVQWSFFSRTLLITDDSTVDFLGVDSWDLPIERTYYKRIYSQKNHQFDTSVFIYCTQHLLRSRKCRYRQFFLLEKDQSSVLDFADRSSVIPPFLTLARPFSPALDQSHAGVHAHQLAARLIVEQLTI